MSQFCLKIYVCILHIDMHTDIHIDMHVTHKENR